MANLNLSEFTEKLFVTDADHTFIWDTAASISKRVSRNSWLNSGTLTSDAPVTISQTWNGTGSTVFKALVVNAAGASGTNSASASLLLDLQVGGVSKFVVGKDGAIAINGGVIKDYGSGQLGIGGGGAAFLYASGNFIQSVSQFAIGPSFGNPTVFITRDADNTLALRNGTSAQTFNVYGAYTSITDYRRLSISVDNTTGNATIATGKGSGTSGLASELSITAGTALNFRGNTYFSNASGSLSWRIDSNFFPQANNAFDFGATSLRVRSGYFGTSVVNSGYAEHAEMTVPAAPAANSVRIYAEDNGSGKTRLMALFATGVAQQIAIEP